MLRGYRDDQGSSPCRNPILEIIKTTKGIVRETRGSSVDDVGALGVLKACSRGPSIAIACESRIVRVGGDCDVQPQALSTEPQTTCDNRTFDVRSFISTCLFLLC